VWKHRWCLLYVPLHCLGFDSVSGWVMHAALMQIEFDPTKNETNIRERLHVLCFTPVANGIRVISFRKANKREMNDYEQTRTTD